MGFLAFLNDEAGSDQRIDQSRLAYVRTTYETEKTAFVCHSLNAQVLWPEGVGQQLVEC